MVQDQQNACVKLKATRHGQPVGHVWSLWWNIGLYRKERRCFRCQMSQIMHEDGRVTDIPSERDPLT